MLIFNNELVLNGKLWYFFCTNVGFIFVSSHDALSYFGCCPDLSHMIRPFLETSGQQRRSEQLGGFGGQSQNHQTADWPLAHITTLPHSTLQPGPLRRGDREVGGVTMGRGNPPSTGDRGWEGRGMGSLWWVDRGKAGLRLTAVLRKQARRTHVLPCTHPLPPALLAGTYFVSLIKGGFDGMEKRLFK